MKPRKQRYDFTAIGERIKAERKSAGYSQDELIDMLREKGIRISRPTLTSIEKGNGSADTFNLSMLAALTDIFNCEIGYLLCEHGYEERTRTATDVCQATGLTQPAFVGLGALQRFDTQAAKEYIGYLLGNGITPGRYPFEMDMLNILLSNYDSLNRFMQALIVYCSLEEKDTDDIIACTCMLNNALHNLKVDNAAEITAAVNKYRNMDKEQLEMILGKIIH